MTIKLNESDPRSSLIQSLKREKILKSESVEDALLDIKREDFVWQGEEALAYIDEPLPLGDTGQTISAPHMVAIMLEEAELSIGMKVLEIGTGSGYNAALIAHIVSKVLKNTDGPLVVTVERNPKLVEFARENLRKAGYEKIVLVVEGDGSLGYPQGSGQMIYDRIIVTAGAPFIPPYLCRQLKIGGLLLVPVGPNLSQTLVKAKKIETSDGKYDLRQQKLMQVMFVPLIGQSAHSN
ncbi:MAG: protein-L-isoaspartate(D-aspartate) O-methyltransferase [archaeon]|nr:protein-L-isoaspartate(D-aspartate) O-methyltransferase [archaeon]